MTRATPLEDAGSDSDEARDAATDTGALALGDTAQRIVDAAAICFYRDGIWATGVDALAAEAGVSKRTLYNYFPSKDAIIAAYLRQREEHWEERLRDLWAQVGDDPVDQVVAYVRGYSSPVPDEVFRGSGFINAAAELADTDHEAWTVIRESLARLQDGIADILRSAAYPDPDDLAMRVLFVLEGAVAVGGALRDGGYLLHAERHIRDLLAR